MSDATADMSLQESCREAARHLSVEVHLVTAKANRLEQENDKLRELVRAAYNCTTGPSCLECRIVAGGCTLLSAMRELGIEVE